MTSLIRLLRPKQWAKNVLVFAGAIFAQKFNDPQSWILSLQMFAIFSLVASGIYVFNDICDAAQDRTHPQKKNRPIANGEVRPKVGAAISVVLLAAGLVWAWNINSWVFKVMSAYAVVMIAYSVRLKHVLLLDVFIIALGFMARPLVGAAAIGVEISKWLMICAFFIGLTLSLIKRRQELARTIESQQEVRNSLRSAPPLQVWDMWIMMISAITILGYTLYTIDPITVAHIGNQKLMYTTPIVVFALFRYHVGVYGKGYGEDPTEAVLADPWIISSMLLWGLSILIVLTDWI